MNDGCTVGGEPGILSYTPCEGGAAWMAFECHEASGGVTLEEESG